MPQHILPPQNLPQQNSPQQNLPQQNSPQQNPPQQNLLQQNSPQQNPAQQTLPQQNLPQQNSPQQNPPQQNLPQQNLPPLPSENDFYWNFEEESGQELAAAGNHFHSFGTEFEFYNPLKKIALHPSILATFTPCKKKVLFNYEVGF